MILFFPCKNHPESNNGTTAGRVLVNSQQALILALFAQRSLDREKRPEHGRACFRIQGFATGRL